MRTPVLIATVILIHVVAIGSVMMIQGCGSTQATARVEPPPAPVMPPRQDMRVTASTEPVFQAPRPVEPAPSMTVPSGEKVYVVQKGDVLSKIAAKLGVSTRELIEINGIKNKNKIFVGQKLTVPDYAASVPGATTVTPKRSSKPAIDIPEGGLTYTVRKGDYLSKIARKYGVKVSSIRSANSLKGDKILVGQKLIIPSASGTVSTPRPTPRPAPKHVVKSMPKPAPRPIIEQETLAVPDATPILNSEAITSVAPSVDPEPEVTVPGEPTLSTQSQPLDYTVQEGDSIEGIAKLFIVRTEDIMALNGISDPNTVLQPGRKIKIPPTDF